MRAKLSNLQSIPQVVAEMTLDEKLDMVGCYRACHTRPIPDMDVPAIYLMGNPVQNTGRCLGTAGVNPKYYPHIITLCVINALLSMWVMQLLF